MATTLKVLVVEDEFLTVSRIKIGLGQRPGAIVLCAASGEAALALARQDPPDVVLMDIRLIGKLDGIDTAAALKAIRDVPVIFISGYEDEEIMERAAAQRPLAYLVKPFEMASLLEVLDRHFPESPT